MKIVKNNFLNKSIPKIILSLIILILLGVFFSYRLLEVPTGLTGDEAAFGYNATLLSRTAHDQYDNFLPIFVLSLDRDWRQPIPQYYMAAFFKVFGPSIYNLRLSSVVITLLSATLLFFLVRSLIGAAAAIFASGIFLLTPQIMIQSHLGLDNIIPIPFTILWLLGLSLFQKRGKRKYLILSGLALGLGFYAYKGMRAVVPVWVILTVFYLFFSYPSKSRFSSSAINNLLIFGLSILPFFIAIPFLERQYPGAIFDRLSPVFTSVYDLVYYYFSYFDPTFLFIKGDATPYHSTGQHGMMLLASLPFFVVGCYRAVREKNFWILVLVAFFTTPLLYGLATTAYRASRVMAMIPLYSLLATLGAVTFWEYKKAIWGRVFLLTLTLLVAINYFDFTNYYWFTYPKATENIFGHLNEYQSFAALSKEAAGRNLTPYISANLMDNPNVQQLFYQSIYFPQGVKVIKHDSLPPQGSILITDYEKMPGMERINLSLPAYSLHIRR